MPEFSKLEGILQEKFTNSFRKGYVHLKNATFPKRYEELVQDFDNFEVNQDDIWICSYPKTGTTWMQEMVWMIMNNLDFEKGKENLGSRSPFFEVSILFDYRDLMAKNPDFRPPEFLQNSINFVKNTPSPICIKTHFPYQCLPLNIQNGLKSPKMIYVTRNPKDTCISYFHHCKLMEGFRGDFEEFCELFLAGKVCFGSYWDHVLSYWNNKSNSNLLFVKYEDMKADLSKVITEVSQFLERPLSQSQIETLKEHLSFESMKNNPAVNYEMVCDLNKKFNLIEHDGVFMRSGTVGGYKNAMTKDIIERFDEMSENKAKGNKYVF